MAFEEVKPEESESFRNDTFMGKITKIGFKEKVIKEDLKDMVTFEFEEGSDLDFFEPEAWGEVKDFMGIGRIISDLRKTGIKWMVDPDERLIKTSPSIVGLVVRFNVTKTSKTYNGEEKTFTNWNLEIVDPSQIGKTDKGTGSTQKEEPADNSEMIDKCENDIIVILANNDKSGTEKDIIKGITEKYTELTDRKPIQKVRKETIQKMINDKTLTDNVGTYSINETKLQELVDECIIEVDDVGTYTLV